MSQCPQTVDVPVIVHGDTLRLLKRLSRMSAGNVVRDPAPPGVAIGRVHCHLNEHSKREEMPALKRKRTQPVGSTECGECGKIVSANKGVCFTCQMARTMRGKERADLLSHAVAEHAPLNGAAAA